MRVFGVLLKKELRELLTPLVFVPLLITIVIFYGIGQLGSSENERLAQTKQKVAVSDQDHSLASTQLAELLGQQFEVVNLESG